MERKENIEVSGDDNIIKISSEENLKVKGDHNKIIVGKKEGDFKKTFNKTFSFLKQKKVMNLIFIGLFLLVLISGSYIRTQNLGLLKDQTSGEYIPLALDPFYFLRVAETIVEEGSLPDVDSKRYPSLEVGYSEEILPDAIVFLYKVMKPFNSEITLQFVHVISPVLFFGLALIIFFFLVYVLTKDKWISLLASSFLAYVPSYLYRTLAGFADHEAIGMFAFFLAMLFSALMIINLKKDKKFVKRGIILSVIAGFFSAFSMVSWGGIAIFLFMIVPFAFLILWLVECQKENFSPKRFIYPYLIWIISGVIFGLIFGGSFSYLTGRFMFNTTGLLSLFVPVFMVIDSILMKNGRKIKQIKPKYRQAYSFGIAIVLGIIVLAFEGTGFFELIRAVWGSLIHPFGEGRVGLTVAENAQPYLVDWIGQTGKVFFWIFIAGLSFIGFDISKGIKSKKERNIFSVLWIFMFSGIIFSRISSSSMFNGTNLISQAFYIIPLIIFVVYSAKLYFNKKFEVSPENAMIISWMFFMIISARSAIRFFFAITPFMCFASTFFIFKIGKEAFKKRKDELKKIILIIILILGLIGSAYALITFYNSTNAQAKYTGPSANYQWQEAMSWVRDNTPEDSIFVHWWDYGYWVQTLGERTTVTDGGHANGYWDHLIGRYILTTPFPETALSFMKAHDVSYLLIDPTDLGKYGAYSSIGGNDENDRFAYISVLLSDSSQIRETSTGAVRIFQGGIGVDEDIIYNNEDGSQIFIPGPTYDSVGSPSYKAYMGGVMFETGESDGNVYSKQPEAIYIYNSQQINIPLRYVYYDGELVDFGSGLDGVFYVFPRIYDSSQGIQFDDLGAGIYLSPKVSKSLFAQLYLMNDPQNKYPSVELAHSEEDIVTSSIRTQGLDLGQFVYYNGFRGPIKIWEVKENSSIIAREEFLEETGDYAELDELQFIK